MASIEKKEKTTRKSNTKVKSDTKERYQSLTLLEQIKHRPDTYIGSTKIEKAKHSIIATDENDTKSICEKEIRIAPGLISIVEEIIVNAFDNHNRIKQKRASGEKLKKQTYIKIKIDRETNTISVENDGEGIEVYMHPKEKIYVPQMVFFKLLTSENYDDTEERTTGGRNGFGAKLTAIFSNIFCIETVDRTRKIKYSQACRENMTVLSEPKITTNYTKPAYTRIVFTPDYSRFNMEGITDDFAALLEKRAYDLVACSHGELKVFFNDIELNAKDINDYISLYIGDTDRIYKKVNDRWAIGAAVSPSLNFRQVSFVNGINTSIGGKHVDYITKQITSKMAKYIMTKKKIDVKENFIKDNMMVFVISTIVNPSFSSQTKEMLKTTPKEFGSICEVPDELIIKLANYGVMERAISRNEFQDKQLLKKTDGKKKSSLLGIDKLYDAGYAGTKRSSECCLILTEGDSAKATAMAGISVIPDGNNKFGIFPLRGKMLNTRDKDNKTISQNTEVGYIKEILALEEGKNYENTSTLRYGSIMIMTDQDLDGSHIKGLLMNFLSRWSSLIKLDGFITSLLTPIVKATKGKSVHSFYTLQDFEKWHIDNSKGWHIKYYKGLGTSTPKEAREYFQNFKKVTYIWDENSLETLDMAFNTKRADDRKIWLGSHDPNLILDIGKSNVSFTDFVNKDLIHFSRYDLKRSVPALDGLKPSTRKILFCSNKRHLKSDIRVAQFSGYISEHGAYHHGEISLQEAIIGMAQNFCGANNINLLVPSGQFGSRLQGGKDHAASRYIQTHLSPITNIIFDSRDEPLYKYTVDDDGNPVEPVMYLPIVPMGLINGCNAGIGTGWACSIPHYHPMDVIKNIKLMLNGDEPIEMMPWYRGFKGSFVRLGNMSWFCRGCYSLVGSNTIIVTELPIGIWTDGFKQLLEYLIIGEVKEVKKTAGKTSAKKVGIAGKKKGVKKDDFVQLVKSYEQNSTDTEVYFKIKFDPDVLSRLMEKKDADGISDLEKQLCLVKKMSYVNSLNIFNEKEELMHFKSSNEILKYYYGLRYRLYTDRKKYWLNKLEQDLFLISIKVKFIYDVIKGKIEIKNVPKAKLVGQLEEFDYPKMVDKALKMLKDIRSSDVDTGNYDYLITMAIQSLTKERIEKLKEERDKLQTEVDNLKMKTEKMLWEDDLACFLEEYDNFVSKFYKETGLDSKVYEKRQQKKKQYILAGNNSNA
jgi:DNA topoisomerase II